jgi:multimeric flavodoxin WrbA
MKKITIINSSPRVKGNCDILCSEFGRGALINSDNIVVRYDLKDSAIDFLREEQKSDDLDTIAAQMIDSNVIVLATPVYFYDMSGLLKTFIDRMVPYFMQLGGKDFYFILTSGVNKSEMESTVQSLTGFTDCIPESNVAGVIYGSNVTQKGDILDHPAFKEAFEFASRIL